MWWEHPYLGSINNGNNYSIWWRSKQHQPSNSFCKPKHSTPKKVILSTVRYKNTASLPKVGNDKTTNLRKHTCKAKWDELYSRDTVSKNYHQHGRSKGTHHEQSNRRINGQEKTVPVWLLRAFTYHLKGLPYRAFLPKRKKKPWIWVFLNKRRRRQQQMHYQKQKKYIYFRGVIDEWWVWWGMRKEGADWLIFSWKMRTEHLAWKETVENGILW